MNPISTRIILMMHLDYNFCKRPERKYFWFCVLHGLLVFPLKVKLHLSEIELISLDRFQSPRIRKFRLYVFSIHFITFFKKICHTSSMQNNTKQYMKQLQNITQQIIFFHNKKSETDWIHLKYFPSLAYFYLCFG